MATIRARGWLLGLVGLAAVAGLTVLLLALLTNIFERRQEGRQTAVRLVEVTEDTMDPKVWGQNWPCWRRRRSRADAGTSRDRRAARRAC